MTSSLRDRAAAAATDEASPGEPRPSVAGDSLDPVEYTGDIVDAPAVPVHIAWARVMADVQSISKGDRRDDAGGKYNFRGVDRVVNAVGPALRRHGVLLLPVRIFDVEYRELKTAKGNAMQECTLKVDWLVVGPMGDELPVIASTGQANDTGDKATAKAVSVAQRVLFLAALHIPTQDPTIDVGHDRGAAAAFDPHAYRDEALNPRTSAGRIAQMVNDLKRLGVGHVLVTNEHGDEEKLGNLLWRVGKERQPDAAANDQEESA